MAPRPRHTRYPHDAVPAYLDLNETEKRPAPGQSARGSPDRSPKIPKRSSRPAEFAHPTRVAGQNSAERRQKQPVARRERRPRSLPAQNREFVPQHDDLQVLRGIPTREQHEQLQQAANDEIHERHQRDLQGQGSPTLPSSCRPFRDHSGGPDRVCAPHAPRDRCGRSERGSSPLSARDRRTPLRRPQRGRQPRSPHAPRLTL